MDYYEDVETTGGWTDGGTNVYVTTTTDNVGIGTSSPVYTLQIAGTVAGKDLRFGTVYNNLLPAGTGANNQILKTNASGVISWQADNVGGSADFDNVTINTNPAGQLQITAGTSPAGKMLLSSAGGTIWADTSAGGGGGSTSFDSTFPQGVLYIKSGNTASSSTLIVSDGSNLSIGIGTTGNSSRLYIRGAGTNTGMNLRIADSAGTNKLVILDNGNLGIGTTNPSQKLDIIGNILASGTIAGNILTGTNVTSGADPGHTHTGTSLSSVDISADTNLAVTSPILLTGDTVSISTAPSFTGLTVTGTSNLNNIASGTWSGDVLAIGKIPTIPLATQTSGTLPDASAPININAATLTSGTFPAARIPDTAVVAGSYTATDLTVDSAGRITAASSGAGGAGDVTAVGDALTGAVFVAGDTDSLLGNLIGIGATHSTAYLNIKSGTGTAFILKVADTGSLDRLVIKQDGNVGIGTTAPIYTLQVAGTAVSQTLQFGTAYNNILPAGTGANNQILKTNASGVITWQADADTGGGGSTRVMYPLSIAGLKVSGTDILSSQPLRIDAGDTTWKALGNSSTPQYGLWIMQLPTNYSANPAIRVGVTAASNPGGNLVISIDVQKNSDADGADIDTPSYDTINTVGNTMPATAGTLEVINIPLTNFDSSTTAGDTLKIRIQRDADDATDTLTGDIEFRSAAFLYDRN